MNARKIILLPFLLLFLQSVSAQTINSSLSIKFRGENYVVSGVVNDNAVRTEIIEKVKASLGANGSFDEIAVDVKAKPFQTDWRADFERSLAQLKNWKWGIFVFSNAEEKPVGETYPPLPTKLADARFLLADGRTVSPNDFNDKLLVLFFMELWAGPAITQAQALTAFYPQISGRNVEILSISSDTSPAEQPDFRKQYERHKFPFNYGWADQKTFENFAEVSKLKGVPQVFLIHKGKLRGIFMGSSQRVTDKLKEAILKILDENN